MMLRGRVSWQKVPASLCECGFPLGAHFLWTVDSGMKNMPSETLPRVVMLIVVTACCLPQERDPDLCVVKVKWHRGPEINHTCQKLVTEPVLAYD